MKYESPLMATSEAASYLQIAERTLHNWRYRGSGPKFCRIGSRPLYRKQDLDEWISLRVFTTIAESRKKTEAKR